MKQAGWGRIINLSGGAGRTPGTAISTPARNISCVALTKSLANTLGPFGINVNAIYPGTTITEAVLDRHRDHAKQQGTTLDTYLEELRQHSPIRHLVTAERRCSSGRVPLLPVGHQHQRRSDLSLRRH